MAKPPPGTTQVWKHLGYFLSTWAYKLSQVKLLVMLSFNTSTLYSQYWLCWRNSKGSSEHSLLRAGLQDQADSTSRPWVMSGPLHHTIWALWGLISPSLVQMPRLPPPTQPSVLEDPLQTYEANHKIIWLWNAKWHLSCATYIFLPSVLGRFPICVPRICPFPALPVLSSRHHPLQGKPAASCSPACRTLPHNPPFQFPAHRLSLSSQRDNMQIHSSLSLSPVWLVSMLFHFFQGIANQGSISTAPGWRSPFPLHLLHTPTDSLQALPFSPQLKLKGTDMFLSDRKD